MVNIQAISGELTESQLGCTLVHEHLRIRSEAVFMQFPHLYNEEEEFQKAVKQVKEAKKWGVQTICDPTVMELGRDIRFMERVVQATGMQIIAATGIYSYHYIPTHFQNRDIDYMTSLFVHDIEVGIQQTSIKAGFLKCATDKQGITPDVEKVIRAVARAHHQTGVPIMTHSHPASGTGLQQLDILEEEGVDPGAILIGHCGDTDDLDYILRVIDRGAFVGMDRYGITRGITAEQRNDTIVQLAKRGYADRMFLSQDYCCTIDWYEEDMVKKVNPDWSMTYLFESIIPQLKELGVTEEQIETMMNENIKAWFRGGRS